MRLPAEVYELSPRQMPRYLQEHRYDMGFEPRNVRSDGSIKLDGKMVFVGEAFTGEVVGIKPSMVGGGTCILDRCAWAFCAAGRAPLRHSRRVSPMFPVAPVGAGDNLFVGPPMSWGPGATAIREPSFGAQRSTEGHFRCYICALISQQRHDLLGGEIAESGRTSDLQHSGPLGIRDLVVGNIPEDDTPVFANAPALQ